MAGRSIGHTVLSEGSRRKALCDAVFVEHLPLSLCMFQREHMCTTLHAIKSDILAMTVATVVYSVLGSFYGVSRGFIRAVSPFSNSRISGTTTRQLPLCTIGRPSQVVRSDTLDSTACSSCAFNCSALLDREALGL